MTEPAKFATAEEWLDWLRNGLDPDVDEVLAMRRRSDGKPYRVVVPCDCDYEGCRGWGMVPAPYGEDEDPSATARRVQP